MVCVSKSTFVLLTLLIPALGSPLSTRCCRCAEIVIQNGCQMASRVTDICGKKHYPRDHFGSIKAASRMCVCCGKH